MPGTAAVTEVVELRLAPERRAERVETLAEVVGAEVVESGRARAPRRAAPRVRRRSSVGDVDHRAAARAAMVVVVERRGDLVHA